MRSQHYALRLLLCGALAGATTILACSEDPEPAEQEGSRANARDAGNDARRDARAEQPDDEDESVAADEEADEPMCRTNQTRECDDCDEDRCLQRCMGGTWSECVGVEGAVNDLLDGGLGGLIPDGAVRVSEAGVTVTFGDASATIPTSECPDSLQCASRSGGLAGTVLSGVLMGASFCAMDDDLGLPPTCTTQQDCNDLGLTQGACTPLATFGSFCIQLCQ